MSELLYFVERLKVLSILVNILPASDLIKIEIFASSVVVGQSVISSSLNVDGHQVASGEVQCAEHVPVKVRRHDVILPLSHLRRHAHQKLVDVRLSD